MPRDGATVARRTTEVDGCPVSYLTAGTGPVVLLLHGTYWSRVWTPVIEQLASSGLCPVAVDLPGLGFSAGQLTPEDATVPALAGWAERFLDELAPSRLAGVAGHDIGGAITQHLAVRGSLPVPRFALVNSVTYDSWPVPGVARFRDPEVVAAVTVEEILQARRTAVSAALHRAATEEELDEYVAPWRELRVARSWMALAAAADSRYTLALLDDLRLDQRPKLLVWGEEDTFQPVEFARRFAREVPNSTLTVIPASGHIPMENDPGTVARELGAFFSA